MHEVNDQGEHTNKAMACEAQAREYTKRGVFVAKNGYYWDLCKTHALTEHDGGGCIACQKAKAST